MHPNNNRRLILAITMIRKKMYIKLSHSCNAIVLSSHDILRKGNQLGRKSISGLMQLQQTDNSTRYSNKNRSNKNETPFSFISTLCYRLIVMFLYHLDAFSFIIRKLISVYSNLNIEADSIVIMFLNQMLVQ